MLAADLYMHSHYRSDGEFSVEQLALRCLDNKINVFSITDYNPAKANREGVAIANAFRFKYSPGFEIDCI